MGVKPPGGFAAKWPRLSICEGIKSGDVGGEEESRRQMVKSLNAVIKPLDCFFREMSFFMR